MNLYENCVPHHPACTYRYASTLGPKYALPFYFSVLEDAKRHKRQADKYLNGLTGHDTMRIEELVDEEWMPVHDS